MSYIAGGHAIATNVDSMPVYHPAFANLALHPAKCSSVHCWAEKGEKTDLFACKLCAQAL